MFLQDVVRRISPFTHILSKFTAKPGIMCQSELGKIANGGRSSLIMYGDCPCE